MAVRRLAKPSIIKYLPGHPINRGLHAAYFFNEGGGSRLVDSGPNGYHGTYNNTPTFGHGQPGRIVTTEETNSENASISSRLGFDGHVGHWSYFVWVYLESTSESGCFIDIGTLSGGNGTGVGLGVGTTTYETGANGNNLVGLYNTVTWLATGKAIGTGWHTVAMTMDGEATRSRFYIDGNLVLNWGHGSNNLAPSGGDSTICGHILGGFNRHLDARMGAVLAYGRRLYSHEVKALDRDPALGFREPFPDLRLLKPAVFLSTVQLTWTDNSGGAQTFNIERSTTSAYAGFSEIASGETSPYDDENLGADTYWYRVRGYDGSDYSDYSNVVEISVT